jgi:hypothetical protein
VEGALSLIKIADARAKLRRAYFTPVPAKLAVCGLFAALPVTFSVAVCFPALVGTNLTAILQLRPEGKVPTVGQVLSAGSIWNWSLSVTTLVIIADPLLVLGLVSTNNWLGLLAKSFCGA